GVGGEGRVVRQYRRRRPQHPLLFHEFPRQLSPVAHVRACSTASRILSATSRLESNGNSVGSPLFPMIVTRFVVTSNPAPGSSASFRMTKSRVVSCSFFLAFPTPSPP